MSLYRVQNRQIETEMDAKVVYRCAQCKTVYRPPDAVRLNYWCCGQELVRVESEISPSVQNDPHTNATILPSGKDEILPDGNAFSHLWKPSWRRAAPEELALIEIIPPRSNRVDALQAETLLGSLLGDGIFSLEIAADVQGIRFLLRAPHKHLKKIQAQIQAVYEQAQFVPVPLEHDPARISDSHIAQGRMQLRRNVQLPLRTFRNGDFEESDPMRGLLGAFGHIEPGEQVLAQLVLAPAPANWSDRFQGSTRRIDESISGETSRQHLGVEQIIAGISFVFILGLVLWAFTAFVTQNWLGLFSAGIVLVLAIAGAILLYTALARDRNMDPALVQRKISVPAFDVALRLTAAASDEVTAEARLGTLLHGYRQYNLASGNALEAKHECFDPHMLEVEQWSWWQEFTGRVMRLNIAELASLWHLPTGEGAPLVARQLSKKLLPPRPEAVAHGVLIGHSVHHGREIPVHLPDEMLDHHTFIVAKTQQGKSTLMAHLARAAMERNMAVVVIDPHGDLVRSLLGVVPKDKADRTVYLDFSDDRRIVGINMLDMGQGRPAYAVIENLVHVGKLIWQDYWGPRMEDALRYVVRTLIEANEKQYALGEKQFTLLDVSGLLGFAEVRRKLLARFVRKNDVLAWWGIHYEQMPPFMRVEVVNPVLTKIHRFEEHDVIRRIMGQSSSTINVRDILRERQILLVNTANRLIGPDAGGLVGAILLDNLNFVIGEQMRVTDASHRTKVLVIIDEFQSLPGVDYPALLAELQKMGASFVLATQALKQLDELGLTLRASILSNINTLFVFQTSAEDAEVLRYELDAEVEATDIINLERHSCYIKTALGKTRLPIMHVETVPPQAQDDAVAAKIRARVSQYTRPVNEVENERNAFWNYWYGREMFKVKGLLLRGANGTHGTSGNPQAQTNSAPGAPTAPPASVSTIETQNDLHQNDAQGTQSGSMANTPAEGESMEKNVGKGGRRSGQGAKGARS